MITLVLDVKNYYEDDIVSQSLHIVFIFCYFKTIKIFGEMMHTFGYIIDFFDNLEV